MKGRCVCGKTQAAQKAVKWKVTPAPMFLWMKCLEGGVRHRGEALPGEGPPRAAPSAPCSGARLRSGLGTAFGWGRDGSPEEAFKSLGYGTELGRGHDSPSQESLQSQRRTPPFLSWSCKNQTLQWPWVSPRCPWTWACRWLWEQDSVILSPSVTFDLCDKLWSSLLGCLICYEIKISKLSLIYWDWSVFRICT